MSRRFKDAQLQAIYDAWRAKPPADVEAVRGQSGEGNAYAVGFTAPDEPCRLWSRGSRTYVAWAAGVDNARAAKRAA